MGARGVLTSCRPGPVDSWSFCWSIIDPASGRPLRFRGITDSGIMDFGDPGDPAYLLAPIGGWAQQAPLDGIAFDSVRPVPPAGPAVNRPDLWPTGLSPDRLAHGDAGLDARPCDTRRLLGPQRDVLPNGIAGSPILRTPISPTST